jgi:hypothetical protein
MGYLILLLTVGVTIYAFVDCWNSTDDEMRGLPRLAWLLVILLFPLIAATAYLLYGRQRGQFVQVARSRVVAPDDDPEFLRKLDQQRRNDAAEERRREQQLRRERKERERQERQQRKERQDDHDGEDHSGHPTS